MNRNRWQSPTVILWCASAILMVSLGTRQTFGLFLRPMSFDLGWGRETFAFAIALQNLVWGLAQPFAGMIADKHGAPRIIILGGAMYALGLMLMAVSHTGLALDLSAGVLIGLGLSGCSFGVVMGVVARTFSAQKRSLVLGIVGAGGSFGQFAMLPYGQALISGFGWQHSLLLMALSSALIIPLAFPLRGMHDEPGGHAGSQNISAALREATSHKGFWYLTFSFAVCGFQTIFIMIHLPAYLLDQGLPPVVGVTALALIGFCNIIGSYGCGYLGGRLSKKKLLTCIYLVRAAAITIFVAAPVTAPSTYFFGAVMGLTWLGTVPLTNGLVAHIFGVRYLATLFGIAFLGHQIGSFLGAWYGGYVFDTTGSYQTVWAIAIGLSCIAAGVCWPIEERRVGDLPVTKEAA